MRKSGIFLLLLALFLMSCQNVPNEDNEFNTEATTVITEAVIETTVATEAYSYEDDRFVLTIEQAITDFQFMWEFIDENLPSFNLLERVSGLNVDEIRADGLAFLENYSDFISIRDFYDFLIQHLEVYTPIFHLGVGDGGLASLFIFHSEHAQHLFGEVVFDLDWTLAVYHYLFPWQIMEPSEMKLQETISRPSFRVIDDYTALINIPNFSMFPHEFDEFHQLYLSFYEEATALGIENIIFDISRNTGGSTWYWEQHIVRPNIEEELFYELLVFARDSQIILDYFDRWADGRFEMQPINDRQFELEHPEDLDELGLYSLLTYSVQPSHDGTPAFEGNFYILIGRPSFSASDAFANFAYQTGFATLIGRPTGGAGVGFEPFMFSLPESGILVRFDSVYGVNPDGSPNQEIGTLPHYFSEGREHTLTTALRVIAERRLQEQE